MHAAYMAIHASDAVLKFNIIICIDNKNTKLIDRLRAFDHVFLSNANLINI